MSKCKCDDGWVEIDDMWYPCRRCTNRETPAAYVRRIADLMGLADWQIVVDETPTEEGVLATMTGTFGQRLATIQLTGQWDRLDPETQRATVVHELLHAHLHRMSCLVQDALRPDSKRVRRMVRRIWTHEEEYLVEELAQAWAPLLPLPNIPYSKTKENKKP